MFNSNAVAGSYRIKTVIFFALFSVGFCFHHYEKNNRKKHITFSNLPITKIKDIINHRNDYHQRLLRVNGILRGGGLISPLSDTPCFYYSIDVDAYYKGRENGEDWNELHDIFKEERGNAFIIEDDEHNQIQVWPHKIDWEPKSKVLYMSIRELFPVLKKLFNFQQIKALGLQDYIEKNFKAFRIKEEIAPVNQPAWIIGILDNSTHKIAFRAIEGVAPYFLRYGSYQKFLQSFDQQADIFRFFKWFFWIVGGALCLFYLGKAFYEDWTDYVYQSITKK